MTARRWKDPVLGAYVEWLVARETARKEENTDDLEGRAITSDAKRPAAGTQPAAGIRRTELPVGTT